MGHPLRTLGPLLLTAALLAGCSSSSDSSDETTAATVAESPTGPAATDASTPSLAEPDVTEPEVTEPAPTEPEVTEPAPTEAEVTEPGVTEPDDTTADSLPPDAIAGLDDENDDGELDPTCGSQDFGGGLVLRIPCTISSPHEPEDGTVLVEGSLYRLPGDNPDEFGGLSGNLLHARDVDGVEVFIIIFNSDGLFASGSAEINSAETLDAAIRAINVNFPGGDVQVRGHTDALGTAASNQALSEQRAANVQQYLQVHGMVAAGVTSVGLASTQPLVQETNPDGSESSEGRRFNRRVEIVVRIRTA